MALSHTDFPIPGDGYDCRMVREILDLVGDKWSLYVIATLKGGPVRFNQLRRRIDGISQRMLTLTLRGLERDGLVKRSLFPTIPPRVDYELTDVGRGLAKPVHVLQRGVDVNDIVNMAAMAVLDAQERARG